MKVNMVKTILYLLTMSALLFSLSSFAYADSVTLYLNRNTLKNVDDTAGRWQHEGGKVYLNGNYIGDYVVTRRVTYGGTDAQNTAMITMTIFVKGENPPQNVTIQGSHDFSSGKYIGSISAASSVYSFLIGATVSGDTAANTLTLTW